MTENRSYRFIANEIMQPKELKIELSSLRLAARCWGDPHGRPLLALHGWLDNSASFDPLAPRLLELDPDLHIVALDLPGHGHSHHRPYYGGFHLLEYATVVFDVLQFLGWNEVALLGHSMGGGIASLMAGALPERITRLILIEALGLFSREAKEAPERYRRFWEEHLAFSQKSGAGGQVDLQNAIRARSISGQIGKQNARLLVERNALSTGNGHTWRSDARLFLPTPISMTEEQTRAFLRNISAPTLLLLAQNTIFSSYGVYREVIEGRISCVKQIAVKDQLEGGHHLHMNCPQATAELISAWGNLMDG